MKNLFIAMMAIGTLSISSSGFAQETSKIKSETVKVKGVCSMCKKRIEDAAYIKGVKRADWDVKTQELKVVYNADKTTLDKIEQSIAHTGHDAGNVVADKEKYKKLPSCCAYNDGAECSH
ncbi:hypothetical protein DBR32_09600 [Taibaiella sp. KBW10]|uniref:heavy-metal-associated domain-containing protein n=1 Tax=Taibaiella sp. KBW10 TaxID=2153357 RepID=UPI000F591A47|nr:heavy metal-associated domain-containing protein [Taibaiella sp. KBW10]RQO30953.1 hypothetical protein DBR32_09600 [Taibaiella sp. KBW10]